MAVSEMKKLSVICAVDDVDEIMKKMLWLHCVDIRQAESDGTDGFVYEKLDNLDTKIAEHNKNLVKIKETLDLLALHDCKKWEKSLDPQRQKRKLFSPPDVINVEEFLDAGRYDLAMRKLNKINTLSNQLSQKKEFLGKLNDSLRLLDSWSKYDARLDCTKTKYTEIKLGLMNPKTTVEDIYGACGADAKVFAEIVGRDKRSAYVSVIYYKDDSERVLKALYSKGFTASDFGNMEGTVPEEKEKISESIKRTENEIEEIHEKIAHMVGCENQLQATYDIISTSLVKLNAEKKILKTGSVCIINGWVPTASEAELTKMLDRFMCAYETEEPAEGDESVPVLLNNNRFASAFEPVVALYSLPKYKTFDPTFVMSFFYVIIFGLMFADVVYGLILTLGCLAAIKWLYPTGTMRNFFRMFAICGVSCMVCGVLLGGYFGDFPISVMGIPKESLALWFDPLKEPMTFLVLSLAIGVVHLLTGMIINMIILIKKKKVFSAIFDVGSWIVIFVGVGIIFVSKNIGICVAVAGVLMLVLTQGRHEKNIFLKFFKGIISLYDITSYASDLLSYSRILALGLASAVIAQVVNVMATLVGGSAVGVIFMILILIIGHLMNIAINVLGTFVHTSRLQYIEFFGKFYDEGGVPFELYAPENKYVILKNRV